MAALAAWAAGTAVATGITWFGANVVLSNAGMGPGMPVVNATVLPVATPAPVSGSVTASPPAVASSPVPSLAPSPRSPSPAGSALAYTLAGGRVTLAVTPTSVQLVTAVPDAGYAVQTWSGTGWLRVDFSSGPQVSSLIASWYEHAPAITVTN